MRRANWIKVSLLALLASLAVNIEAVRPASATPINTFLSLVIDTSGSISASDFTLQTQGYVNGLNALLPTDGSVAVNVINFSDVTVLVQTALRINNATDLSTLTTAIGAMTQIGSTTAIGDGITAGVTDMETFFAGLDPGDIAASFNKIVDVSTDGENNTGSDPATASSSANGLGYAVNCLGIGGAANCDFNNGFGTDFSAASFTDFNTALTAKLQQEVIGGVPEPASLVLLGSGLLGLGLARRRRKKAKSVA